MKFKILLFVILFFLYRSDVFAGPVADSVDVKNNKGKKEVIFKVKAKDTYYSIGRRYHVTPEALMKFNGAKKANLSLGEIVKVPTDQPFGKSGKVVKETAKEKKARLAEEKRLAKKQKELLSVTQNPAPNQAVKEAAAVQPVQTAGQPVQNAGTPPTEYKVSAGETLYSISKRFNTTVDDITKLNNLTSTILSPGQILLVRPAAPAAQPAAAPVVHYDTPVVKRDSTPVATVVKPTKDSSTDHRFTSNRFGLYEKDESGIATWIDDTSLDPSKKLVLHRIAPIGTVIKITNPMTNRTTFAKVVGRFTDSEATKDVIIVMTKNVADALGALDKRFRVNISYGSPNE
jgi:LysM repeat protein